MSRLQHSVDSSKETSNIALNPPHYYQPQHPLFQHAESKSLAEYIHQLTYHGYISPKEKLPWRGVYKDFGGATVLWLLASPVKRTIGTAKPLPLWPHIKENITLEPAKITHLDHIFNNYILPWDSRKTYKGTKAYMKYFTENENAIKTEIKNVLIAYRECEENVKESEQVAMITASPSL